jgi:menaquinone-specific isochorismate synthase
MKSLPLDPDRAHSREALAGFLAECRGVAVARGRPQLASITLEAGHLDPLAVLESIYDPGELHFYCERPAEHFAVAGAEAVVRAALEGPSRFDQARRFIEETLEDTIAVGDMGLPFAGPHFFCAAGFFDRASDEFPFPAAAVFVPRWQVGCRDDRFAAVANVLVAPEAALEPLVERVWRAHAKFRSFDYAAGRAGERRTPASFATTDAGTVDHYLQSVRAALGHIASGRLRKIVLARALDVRAPRPFHPLGVLAALRQRFPDCFAFSVGNGRGQSFIGASPERLVRIRGREVWTEALAGSAPRGATASEDAAFGSALLRSEKDLREHALVVESVVRRLARLGLEASVGGRPRLRRFSNVQHLHSPVVALAPRHVHVLDAVAELHPTPAVGGTPRDEACGLIADMEACARGLYAGPIGWADAAGDGEFLVGIRSALIDGGRARVYAGGGIVAGSVPEEELAETETKFHAMLDVLRE